jgi:hypothetical protein
MKYLIYSIWAISFLIYLRASFLAQGKVKKKFFIGETFQLGQAAAAILFLGLIILSFAAHIRLLFYLNILNLVYTFLFYLQPTPRTTRTTLKLFLLTNIIFAALYVF